MKKHYNKTMERLGDLIQKRLQEKRWGVSVKASEVLFSAQQFLQKYFEGEMTAIRPFKLQNGVLWLGAENAVAGEEGRHISFKLLRFLQEQYGPRLIQKICIKSLTMPRRIE